MSVAVSRPSSSISHSFDRHLPNYDDDPLTAALAPPPDETAEQRELREAAEAEARRVSDEIDEQLRNERMALKKKKAPVKVLLLGQSESGKSTTLKNFQMQYARTTWLAERSSWRAVIQLNLLRSINNIIDHLSHALSTVPPSPTNTTTLPNSSGSGSSPPSPHANHQTFSHARPSTSTIATTTSTGQRSPPTRNVDLPGITVTAGIEEVHHAGSDSAGAITPPRTSPPTSPLLLGPLQWTDAHRTLKLRLAPLKGVQQDLEARLGSAAEEPTTSTSEPHDALPMPPPPLSSVPVTASAAAAAASAGASRRPQEFYVRSRDGWKSALEKLKPWAPSSSGDSAEETLEKRARRKEEEVSGVLAGCGEAMKALWEDGVVREMLRRKKITLENGPGFFLNDIERITKRDYEPSDDDVIRARLRTVGVQEYSFSIEQGRTAGHEWLMYDVGGTRSSRAIWYPYFDDMDAIIFLAPISCFDERLAEDRRVNRLEDTYMLWKTLCGLKLLSKTQIILFLNKCDLLERKLQAGVRVRDYVPSYGDRENTVETVKKYFQSHFKEIAKQNSPEQRRFYVHLTTVVDTRATAATLRTVEEGILRDSLRRADLL
ncbi:G-alpha-domain-containing protein [Stereum hirsutum FP-91666 SS1]|uniref:G-alpha-domain-containing protein n=1 Tax=Stereum hirsutum (strain FP-91666) TaxID=721885 RepID=R7RZ71_STEHR|nr:G-alpha-domain-containing protein [Stereum hirsutum FP-91666 SS1]EIM80220.1 G-alpha-domain-containing protein [Stereum hirsutum FP-91666 SS1]